MYGIIHEAIYDSTVMAEGFEVVYVFQSMIILANGDDVVDMGIAAFAKRINLPLEKLEHAIGRLTRPDPESKSQEEEGRRIVALKDITETESNRGWFVVNREMYILVARKDRRKTYMRDLMRKRREKANTGTESANNKDDVSTSLAHGNDNENNNENINEKYDGDLECAKWMQGLLLELNPKQKTPNYEDWTNTIRLIRERDGKTEQEIYDLFQWAHENDFWKVNILSPKKLRLQWDKLTIQMFDDNKPPDNSNSKINRAKKSLKDGKDKRDK